MNRRKALWLSLLSGGLWPARALAQDGEDDYDLPPRDRRRAGAIRSARRKDDPPADEDIEAPPAQESPAEGVPSNFGTERGEGWRTYDITRYTGLPHNAETAPQNALIEWIFRRTGSAAWHGEKVAVLCASRTQLRAFQAPAVLKQVEEMVELFLRPTADFLQIRVNIVAAADPRWRYDVYSRLVPKESGPQGQQVWTLSMQDAAFVRARMAIYQGFTSLYDQKAKMINGQTIKVEAQSDPVNFVAGPRHESAVGLGVQPGTGQLQEGVVLSMSPLLRYEGDSIDAYLDLKTNLVRKLHATKILTRREIGPVDMSIDVPEASETRLIRTIKNWKLGETLLISAGVQPGLLLKKSGWFNLPIPGTMPTTTELLVFIDAEVLAEPIRSARAREL